MTELEKKYRKASEIFVAQTKLDNNVIGIIISGSLVYSTIDKNSDIDIYIVLDDDCEYRERGNTWINGIEIEYFKNPPEQIRAYFKNEVNSPHTAHMLAKGELVWCKSNQVKALINEANQIIERVPIKLNRIQIELEKYFIDDLFKDIADSISNDNQIGGILIRNKLIDRCIDIFFKAHRVRREKDKRLSRQIGPINPSFLKILDAALIETWDEIKALIQLKHLTEELLGGQRALEWNLKSNLEI